MNPDSFITPATIRQFENMTVKVGPFTSDNPDAVDVDLNSASSDQDVEGLIEEMALKALYWANFDILQGRSMAEVPSEIMPDATLTNEDVTVLCLNEQNRLNYIALFIGKVPIDYSLIPEGALTIDDGTINGRPVEDFRLRLS
jgi:hypothetical protein